MEERRESRRMEVDLPVTLAIEGTPIRTRMINYSPEGALFRVGPEDAGKVSTEDLGKEGTFVIRVKSGPTREYRGEVLRYYTRGEDRYIVLRFWNGYRELEG